MTKLIAGLILAAGFSTAALAAEKTETIKVSGWHCGGCAARTESALKDVKGVSFPAEPFLAELFLGRLGLPAALPLDHLPAAAQRLAAEGRLGVDHDGVAHFLEERSVGHAVRVEIAAPHVDAVPREDLLHTLSLPLAKDDGRDQLVARHALLDDGARSHRFVGVQEAPQLVDDELRRPRRDQHQVAHEQVPAHRAQPLLRDALLDVPLETLARQVAQPVGANALLGAAAERDHVRLGKALARIFIERPRHLRAHGWGHLAVGVQIPGEDRPGVPVEERVVDVEHRRDALERLHHFPSR